MGGSEGSLDELLESKGVTIGPDGQMIRAPGYTGPTHIADELLRYFNEKAPDYDIDARLRCYWVNDLAEVSAALGTQGDNAPWPFRTAFWIRLHGVLNELRTECLETFRRADIDPTTHTANRGSLLALELEKYRCIEVVRQQFSEDELVYADYLRQTNGHPTQAQYAVRWSNANGGQINDRRRISTVGREFTVAELDAAVRRVLAAFTVNGRPNEWAVATNFAQRVHPVMPPLVAIMRRTIGA